MNMSSKIYQKNPKIRVGDVYKKQVFLEPSTEQHGNEAACTACRVARVSSHLQHGPVKIEKIYCVFFPGKSIFVAIQLNNRSV